MLDRNRFFAAARACPFDGFLRQGQVDGCTFILDQWDLRKPDGDRRWLAYMLATTFHETDRLMQPIEEYGHGAGHPYGVRDPRTGQVYDGRGDVQLTWEKNYEMMGARLGLDLPGHPELALDPKIAADIMFIGMEYGLFTGLGLPRFFNATVDDPVGARRIINGTDRAETIAGYHAGFLAGLA